MTTEQKESILNATPFSGLGMVPNAFAMQMQTVEVAQAVLRAQGAYWRTILKLNPMLAPFVP